MKYRGKWNDYQWKNIKGIKRQKYDAGWVCKQVGIMTSTISEWKKKHLNPTADKIMDICNVYYRLPRSSLPERELKTRKRLLVASLESRFTPYII